MNTSENYKRRSVENDVRDFAGFEEILKHWNQMKALPLAFMPQFYATAFITGGRLREVLDLKRENFVGFSKIGSAEVVQVNGMKLLKHYSREDYIDEQGNNLGMTWFERVDERPNNATRRLFYLKDGKWERKRLGTKPLALTRNPFFGILNESLDSTLHGEWVDWIKQKEKGEILFPSPRDTKKNISGVYLWKKFNDLGIWPHWMRAQRASCLAVIHHWNLEQIKTWYSWEKLETAAHYARMNPMNQGIEFVTV